MSDLSTQGKAAFVFPGVGVAPNGHEGEFFARHRAVMRPFLEEAAAFAGRQLHAGELHTHAFDCAVAAVYRSHGLEPSCVAGHSLGLYAALADSGAVRFRDALAMVERAHELVVEACPRGGFGMAVVIGMREPEIRRLLEDPAHEGCALANVNNETGIVLSGAVEALGSVLAAAEREGALKATLLDLDLPYHNPGVLAPATERFREYLRTISWRAPTCPVVSSIDQSLLVDPAALLEHTARNISAPIRWQGTVERLAALGVAVAVECGPGISLTQHAYFIPGAPKHVNTKTSKWKLGI